MMVKEDTSATGGERRGRRRAGMALAALALVGGSAAGVARLVDSDDEPVVVGEALDLDSDVGTTIEPDLAAILDVHYAWSENEMTELESRINDLPGVESATLNPPIEQTGIVPDGDTFIAAPGSISITLVDSQDANEIGALISALEGVEGVEGATAQADTGADATLDAIISLQ